MDSNQEPAGHDFPLSVVDGSASGRREDSRADEPASVSEPPSVATTTSNSKSQEHDKKQPGARATTPGAVAVEASYPAAEPQKAAMSSSSSLPTRQPGAQYVAEPNGPSRTKGSSFDKSPGAVAAVNHVATMENPNDDSSIKNQYRSTTAASPSNDNSSMEAIKARYRSSSSSKDNSADGEESKVEEELAQSPGAVEISANNDASSPTSNSNDSMEQVKAQYRSSAGGSSSVVGVVATTPDGSTLERNEVNPSAMAGEEVEHHNTDAAEPPHGAVSVPNNFMDDDKKMETEKDITANAAQIADLALDQNQQEKEHEVDDGNSNDHTEFLIKASLVQSEDEIREQIAQEMRETLALEAAAEQDSKKSPAPEESALVVVGQVLEPDDDPEVKQQRERKRNIMIGLGFCIVIVVVVIVAVVVSGGGDGSSSASTANNSASGPTPRPSLRSASPSNEPSRSPSTLPTRSASPSLQPSENPSSLPSGQPSTLPSSMPSLSTRPSSGPTFSRVLVEIQVLHDAFAEETSWKVVDQQDSNVVASRQSQNGDDRELITTEFFLFPGTYEFTISDEYSDGLFSPLHGYGGYRLLLNGEQRLEGWKFQDSDFALLVFSEDGDIETLRKLSLAASDVTTGLLECQGHCIDDSSCGPGMKCWSDTSRDPPGCYVGNDEEDEFDFGMEPVIEGGASYCYVPSAEKVEPTLEVSNSFPLGLCQGECLVDEDCFGDLTCFERNGSDEVPGCSGRGDDSTNYCFLDISSNTSTTAAVAIVDKLEHQRLYPLGKCLGGCVRNSDCMGSLKCFASSGEDIQSIPGCTGIGGSGYCYDPKDAALDDGLYQEIPFSDTVTSGDGDGGQPGWGALYSPNALVQEIRFAVSAFPESIRWVRVYLSNGERLDAGEIPFPSLNEAGAPGGPEISRFEFSANERLETFVVCQTEDGERVGHISFTTTSGNSFEAGTCANVTKQQSFEVSDTALTGVAGLIDAPMIKSLAPLTRVAKYNDETEGWVEFDDLDECFGGCSSNSDCFGNLECFYRDSPGRVPGCERESFLDWNYCYDPLTVQFNENLYNESVPVLSDCSETNTFRLVLTTDKFAGDEISWVIKSTITANAVAYGTGYNATTTYEISGCLDDGLYEFTIFDSYGDGICCDEGNGAYELIRGTEIVGTGGAFDSLQQMVSFGVPETKTSFLINGQSCDKPIIVGGLCEQDDPEGMVCANTPSEAYCSYDIGRGACAFCDSGPEVRCSNNFPVCPDLLDFEYCTGSIDDCFFADYCYCDVGQTFCDTGVNPCSS